MKILILVLLLASLMLGANALDVRVTQSNGGSGVVVDTSSAANVDDFVDQEIKANPSTGELASSYSFSGPASLYRAVYGRYGGYARSGFTITGSYARTSYSFAVSSYPYAQVSQALTSYNAKNIYAYAYASSNNGNQAMAKIDVYSPANNAYLSGYSNTAYATSSTVQVSQKSSYARAQSSGGVITTDLWAIRSWSSGIKTTMSPSYIKDSSEVMAKMSYYPILGTYPVTWAATAAATSTNTYAQQGIYAYARPIVTTEYAKKYGYSGILRTQTNYGTHKLGQSAYTTSTSYGVKYPHWV